MAHAVTAASNKRIMRTRIKFKLNKKVTKEKLRCSKGYKVKKQPTEMPSGVYTQDS